MKGQEEIFKINDIKESDPLKGLKQATINKIKRDFLTKFLKTKSFKPSHFYYMIEERKGFIKRLFEDYPDLHDPAKKPDIRQKHFKGWGVFSDNTYATLRSHYKLFFTEGLDGNNWREKIRDADSKEKIKEIEDMINLTYSKFKQKILWGDFNLTRTLKTVIKNLKERLTKDLTKEINKKMFIKSIESLERSRYNQGCPILRMVADDIMEEELDEVLQQAQKKCSELGISRKWYKKPSETPEIIDSPFDSDSDKDEESDNSSDDSDSDSDEEGPTKQPGSENPKPDKQPGSETSPEEISEEIEEIKNQLESFSNNSTSGEKKKELEELLKKLREKLENSGDSDSSEQKKKIEELERRLAENEKKTEKIATLIQEFFKEKNSVLKQIKDYFEEKNIKSIELKGDEWIIEHNDNKTEAMGTDKVPQLKEMQKFLESTDRKVVNRSEVEESYVSNYDADSSQTRGHPQSDFGKYLLLAGAAIIVLVVIWGVGVLVSKKKSKK